MKKNFHARRTSIQYMALLSLIFCHGCYPMVFFQDIGAYEKDVSKKKEVWGGYAKGAIYTLRQDMFLIRIDKSENRMYAVVPSRQLKNQHCIRGYYSSPASIEAYHADPQQWPEIEGILKAGTTIQLDKILKHGAWLWGSSYTTFAVIMDDPFSGISVDISDISYPRKNNDEYFDFPNFNLLQPVDL
jgi:hypothetical protein